MIGVQRGADGEAFVAGCGLDVGAAEGRVVEHLPLATLLSAQPPAMARSSQGTCRCRWFRR